MKTNQLRTLCFALLVIGAGRVHALELFECVRELMPISEQASFQGHRKNFEKPFVLNDKYMVFPEVRDGYVSGFFIYTAGSAAYYDAIEVQDGTDKRSIAELRKTNGFSLYNLVAQPLGLETVSFSFMPALGSRQSNRGGPVILGSSVLPVVGAMISRPSDQLNVAYRNPAELDDQKLKDFVREHSSRAPAANAELDRQFAHLTVLKPKSKTELWKPLNDELNVRETWVKHHNLNEEKFRKLARIMESTCKP